MSTARRPGGATRAALGGRGLRVAPLPARDVDEWPDAPWPSPPPRRTGRFAATVRDIAGRLTGAFAATAEDVEDRSTGTLAGTTRKVEGEPAGRAVRSELVAVGAAGGVR